MGTERLRDELLRRQLADGWGYRSDCGQTALEPTCLALLALRLQNIPARWCGVAALQRQQNPDGGWPAFAGDREACGLTGLAVLTLNTLGQPIGIAPSIEWLLRSRGREAHWLWKWKFCTTDTRCRFDPGKFGWPWQPRTDFGAFSPKGANRQKPPTCERIRSFLAWLKRCPSASNLATAAVPPQAPLSVRALRIFALGSFTVPAMRRKRFRPGQ